FHPALSPLTTTYAIIRRPVILYVVSDTLFVTLRAGAGKTASLIPSPCYTSGKIAIKEKSDHPKTAIP
nr:hypothetical protein [Salmonella enterica]